MRAELPMRAQPQGELLGTFELPRNSFTMSLSPNGGRLAMMDDDRIVFWDTASQQRIAQFTIPRISVFSLAFCPADSAFLPTASIWWEWAAIESSSSMRLGDARGLGGATSRCGRGGDPRAKTA